MKFSPYGAFLPLQSLFMILERFYAGAVGRAIGAEVAKIPAQKFVRIALGSIGKPFQISYHHRGATAGVWTSLHWLDES